MQGVLGCQVHKKGQPRCEATLATLHRVADLCCTFPGMPVGYRAYSIIVYNFTMSIVSQKRDETTVGASDLPVYRPVFGTHPCQLCTNIVKLYTNCAFYIK